MSFNRFSSNRSTTQNYGNVKGSRREQIIAESRAKRQERQKKKKHENATQIIQKWYRMNISYNRTINQCKKQFNDKITFILQKSQNSNESQLNFANFNHVLHLFKQSIFGFKQNPNKWKLSKKYTSKLSKFETDNKWFITSVRRLYSIFLRIIKTSTKSQHFISQIIENTSKNDTKHQMIQFKLLCIVLIKYLEMHSDTSDIKEQQSVIMSLWSILDCNKWKYFDKISKKQQTNCQIFCYKLLKYLFIKTPFLSVTSCIFITHMKLPPSDNANNTKTILALLHTIIIRYFQFAHINKHNNVHIMDVDKNENKMSEDDNESKMDKINDEDSQLEVISMICLEILSIPYYTERLIAYNLQSVIKSFISHNIWSQILTQFNKYCMNTYDSFIFVSKHKKKKTLTDLWQKIISSPMDGIDLNEHEEKKENKNDLDVMDMPDYDDYNDSDSDDEMDDIDAENNKNSLQTFLNMTETSNEENTSELYINPNKKTSSLNKRKKSRKKRRKLLKGMHKSTSNFVTDLPAIVWTIHNLLNLYNDFKTFAIDSHENIKLFISFLNIAQITFNLLDFTTPLQYGYHIAFPYENMDNTYNNYYLHTFNKWCGGNLLSNIAKIISLSSFKISLNDYCILSKYLLQIIRHFPANKQHQIWSNLGLITIDNNICDTNIISLLYKNVFCKYNIRSSKDWQCIMKQYLDGYAALSYFQQKKKQLSQDVINDYNSSVSSLQESTKCMQIFELFLHGINYFLRIIDDEQFHKYNIPFTTDIWVTFIHTFKYICFVSYWKYYSYFNKFHAYFKRISHKKNKKPLSALNLLQIYNEKFEQFVSSVTCVFACLRDRNSRKTFINDNNIWLMDKYINLHQFEKEILNSQDSDMKNDDNDVEMQNNNAHSFPQVYNNNNNNNNNNFVDQFNPFRNREFGYNDMYGGAYEDNNTSHQSQENLQRFEDNFNKNEHKTENENENYRRSFLILIEIPFVIPFKLRVKLFFKLIQYEKDQLESSGQSIHINRGNAIRVRIHRDNILDDGYRELNKYNHELKTLIQIEFLNKHNEIEAGIDGGGIFKEFLNELIRDAFDPERGLFYETEYKKELYPNPNYFVFKQLMNIDKDYYQFLGKMVGKALYDCVLIEPIFCNFFLRKLLSQHNYIDDLQSYDIELYKQLMLLKHDYSNENKIENMEISFSMTQDILGSKETYNLIVNGENILVNHKNRHKYINILADYKLNKCQQQQCASFVVGMSKVINLDYLRIFDANELSKLLSGDNDNIEININDLRENTVYSGGFHHLHRCVKWFWQILKEDFSQKDKQKLLMFVTSCTRSPLLGFKSLNPKFSIMCTGGQIQNLPTSQTCMNLLKLPNYNTKELLKQKLLKSIRSNAGFDLS